MPYAGRYMTCANCITPIRDESKGWTVYDTDTDTWSVYHDGCEPDGVIETNLTPEDLEAEYQGHP